jgi:putative transposase
MALSNVMDVNLALQALGDALQGCTPRIVNFDQGSQFTSKAWLDMLGENGISPSMTGKGRCIDNIYIERFWRSLKVEEIYLNPHDSEVVPFLETARRRF